MTEDQYHPCSCSGQNTIENPGTYENCPVCEWENDTVQAGGSNLFKSSLNKSTYSPFLYTTNQLEMTFKTGKPG